MAAMVPRKVEVIVCDLSVSRQGKEAWTGSHVKARCRGGTRGLSYKWFFQFRNKLPPRHTREGNAGKQSSQGCRRHRRLLSLRFGLAALSDRFSR
jgi:hypothetical protein